MSYFKASMTSSSSPNFSSTSNISTSESSSTNNSISGFASISSTVSQVVNDNAMLSTSTNKSSTNCSPIAQKLSKSEADSSSLLYENKVISTSTNPEISNLSTSTNSKSSILSTSTSSKTNFLNILTSTENKNLVTSMNSSQMDSVLLDEFPNVTKIPFAPPFPSRHFDHRLSAPASPCFNSSSDLASSNYSVHHPRSSLPASVKQSEAAGSKRNSWFSLFQSFFGNGINQTSTIKNNTSSGSNSNKLSNKSSQNTKSKLSNNSNNKNSKKLNDNNSHNSSNNFQDSDKNFNNNSSDSTNNNSRKVSLMNLKSPQTLNKVISHAKNSPINMKFFSKTKSKSPKEDVSNEDSPSSKLSPYIAHPQVESTVSGFTNSDNKSSDFILEEYQENQKELKYNINSSVVQKDNEIGSKNGFNESLIHKSEIEKIHEKDSKKDFYDNLINNNFSLKQEKEHKKSKVKEVSTKKPTQENTKNTTSKTPDFLQDFSTQPAFLSLITMNEKQSKSQEPFDSPKLVSRNSVGSANYAQNAYNGKNSPSNNANHTPNLSLSRSNFILDHHNSRSLTDEYILDNKKLGQGTYGSVTKGIHKETGSVRAIKMISKHQLKNLDRFRIEVSIMKLLDHPNIIKLYETYEDFYKIYLVMELCEGGELFDLILQKGSFSESNAAHIMKQIFSALNYMHSIGIMHRDLKPENFLLAKKSDISLKIIDFGLSCRFKHGSFCKTKAGTPYYVDPQVLRGHYDHTCDYWSSGVIMYLLLCGYPPFHGDTDAEVLEKVKLGNFYFSGQEWKKISNESKDLIKKLLKFNPRERYTAELALQHPWIQRMTSSDSSSSELPLSLISNLKNFMAINKLKKAALTVIALHASENDINNLKEIFFKLDKDNNGKLSMQEIKEGLIQFNGQNQILNIPEIIEELDSDKSGTVDYTEFLAASIDKKLYVNETACRDAFRVFDLDGDGLISRNELKSILGLKDAISSVEKNVIDSLLYEVDLNGDGQIDFDEFLQMMRKKPEIK